MANSNNFQKISHIHDKLFRFSLELSPAVRIEMINEVYGTHYPLTTPNDLGGTEIHTPVLKHRIGDGLINVRQDGKIDPYHCEFMSYSKR